MESLKRTRIIELIKTPHLVGVGNPVNVKGWVRTKRGNKNVAFYST